MAGCFCAQGLHFEAFALSGDRNQEPGNQESGGMLLGFREKGK